MDDDNSDKKSSSELESFVAETSSDESELETEELDSWLKPTVTKGNWKRRSSSPSCSIPAATKAKWKWSSCLSVACSRRMKVLEKNLPSREKLAVSYLQQLTPLYEGSEITVFESHLLLFQFSVRHSLSAKAFGELLQVVSAHLPPTAKFPKSVYTLKWFFRSLFPDLSTRAHSYCSCCLKLLEEGTQCENHNCASAKVETFITMALEPQLKKRIEGVYMYLY